ncbi:transglutaminase family protein [Lapillicoccus sp.]|uniref:transglutaminase family protein n=1 Tax=Lapillicoccus sp. TaxID=1909287 RepID=UPI0025F5D5B4|nr:transglutaminase family protein [Lapillicoccus sp.]
MRYRVWHRTTYSYDGDVTDSFGVAYLVPRELPWQIRSSSELVVEPEQADRSQDTDYYGNLATYFQVTTRHQRLQVTGTSEVEVHTPAYDLEALAVPWEQARPAVRPELPDAWRASDFALPSPLVDQPDPVKTYAAQSFSPRRPLSEVVTDLMHRIHADFDYEPGATTVTSTIGEVLDKKAGVCQDFAHLALAGLRAHGLAARYVSGYLSTAPPPGRERVVGADASHAWVAVWVPGPAGRREQWLAIDPTNDTWVDDRYVTVAWGRDYGDVPPLKGVIFTESEKSTLLVEVDVEPLG